jgi:hypothetical protein
MWQARVGFPPLLRPELGKARKVVLGHCSEPPENGIDEPDVFSQEGRNRSTKSPD